MSDVQQRLAALTPEQRELLLKRLKEKSGDAPSKPQTGQVESAPLVVPVARGDHAPLSFAQQRLWFIDQLESDSAFYNVPTNLRISGALNVTALEQSLNEVVRRHEVLHTTFAMVDGQPVQLIQPHIALALPVVDLQDLPPAEREAEAQRLIVTEAWRPFNLASGPLLRAMLLRLGPDDYIFLLNTHHIVSDRWSVGVLVREVVTLYQALDAGQPAALPPLPVQYADYAIWQRQWLQGAVLEEQLAYWKAQLRGAPAMLQLPTDRPRPPVQTFRGAQHTFTISKALADQLTALGRREGATLFMTLLAAFQTLLARYSSQEDVVVGTPVAGRTRVELEQLIGLFFNTLVLRTDLSGNPTFLGLLQRVREVCLGAYAHQSVPFEKLVEELRPERDLGYTPIFQVLFDLRNTPTEPLVLPDVVLRPLAINTDLVNFDLALGIDETTEGLICTFFYKTDLFDAATIGRMAGHYQTLLAAVVAQPSCSLAALPLLSTEEQYELLTARNATQAAYPATVCFHELVAEQVARTPAAIAAVCEDRQLSYRELDQAANRLAHALQRRGVGPEVRVGICMDRSLEMLIGLLAIFKADGAFVPLDPSFPTERLGFILSDAQVTIVLTQSTLQSRLSGFDLPLICLDRDWPELETLPASAPISRVTAANLAYLIYTSGSTGRPKGVLIPHQGLVNYLFWAIPAYTAADGRGAPVHASIAADAIFPSLFLPLMVGATVFMVPESQALVALSQTLQTYAPFSLMKITPSQLEVLNRQLPTSAVAGSVHTLVVGAEALRGEVLHFWQQHAPEVVVLNEYGPTETVVGCSIYRIEEVCSGPVPIGLPIANTTFYVLDRAMQPVPVGVPGELYIGGDGVAWGYHGRQALTAERFVPDPFVRPESGRPGARLYKTGDLVRYLPDHAANIEFLGRIDDQVKIRGYRVEPGEVEAVLGQHAVVQEVVVLARADHGDEKRLVAYVVPQPAYHTRATSSRTSQQPELWPSMGEYFLYDELLYHVLTHDERRQQHYRTALQRFASGKIVVDIGTGRDAILARLAVEAGASRVYAIEMLDEAYQAAVSRVHELGLDDRIQVIQGDARTIELPELVDVCVSQIIGVIGGAEGAGTIIEDTRRLLKPDGHMLPERSVTKIAAVSLPDMLAAQPAFSDIPQYYVDQTFAKVGYPFDLRVCIKNFPVSHLLSTADIFEDLDFTAPLRAEYQRSIRLTVTKAGRLDGFLVWLTLRVAEGATLDVLADEYAWLPVYFPIFDPGIMVVEGDVIEAECSAILDTNPLHPDYAISGRVVTAKGSIPFAHESAYARPHYQATPFYQRLFSTTASPQPTALSDAELIERLRGHVRAHLPEYMMPSAFMLLEEIPLTPHGKIDRHALPMPDGARPELVGAAYVAPRTPTEELVVGVWSEMLRVSQVGVHDNFFALGGHSLLATQVVGRLRHLFQIDLPLMHLFEAPTVAALAERVAQAQATATTPTLPLQPIARDRALPLSFIQQRLWLLEQLAPGSGVYNLPLAVRLIGTLDLVTLEQSLQTVVQRHEILRASITRETDQPTQVIASELTVPIEVLDLQNVPTDQRDAQALRQAQELIGQPFELTRGPLLRVHLLRLAQHEHILLLTVHHIIFDGWSGDLLVSELTELYRAARDGEAATLPTLPIQYPDFAAWQQQWLQGKVLDAQLAYWQEQLRDLTTLALPTDQPRPPVLSFRGATEPIVLSLPLTNQLRTLSRREGVTLFMTLLATLQIVLYRYSGQDDIAVGTTIANRTRPEVERLIGCFVNNLVLRTSLAGSPTVRQLLQRVRAVALGAYMHQDLPFEKLVEALQPERDNSRNPLFQILFALQTDGGTVTELPGLAMQQVDLIPSTSQFDMALSLAETADGMRGILTYSTDLFTAATIRHFIGHFITALESSVAQPDSSIDQLVLLPMAEQQQLLHTFNTTAQPTLLGHTAYQLFEQQAARTPDAVALVFEDTRLRYAELNQRANQLARALRARGVGTHPQREVLVGIAVERSLEQIIAVLGVLKAGGAYLPLDSANPIDRLATILADAQPSVLLTTSAGGWPPPALVDGPWSVLDLLADRTALEHESAENLPASAMPDNLAYVIYTSGSTGRPKGVQLTHDGLCNLALAQTQLFEVTPESRVLQFAAFGFDASVSEIFATLLGGATLVLARRDVLLSTDDLLRLLRDQAITTITLPPSYLALLDPQAAPGLRTVVSAGERCPAEIARRWAVGRRFINAYGPTETTVGPLLHVVDAVPGSDTSVPIGRPIANTAVYILDRQLQPVPIGVPGELYISGVGLARGYLRQPALTAQSFLPNLFASPADEPGSPARSRLYRTGDLVRYLPDGTIVFLGRRDTQVKIRGFRIEPGEVEAVLLRHALVQEAAVVARPDPRSDQQRLVAYVVSQPEATDRPHKALIDVLRTFLKAQLPDYMIPAAFVVLAQMPLTTNGKLNQQALPAPEATTTSEELAVQAPRTPTEEVLVGIWSAVLGLAQVDVQTSFFDLGGHSLLATQVMVWVRETFQMELPLRTLFTAPTITKLAARIDAARATTGLELPPLRPVPRDQPLPLSFTQQRLWMLDQLTPGNAYTIPLTVRLHGHLNPTALRQSLEAVVRRHEVLHTTIDLVDGKPAQIISAVQPIELAEIDLRDLPTDQREPRMVELAQAEADRWFDLTSGPLFRATLLRMGEDDHVLLLTLHHIIADGWSLSIFIREIAELYQAVVSGQIGRLSQLPVQYADYAVWQRACLSGATLETQLAYWRRQLDGAPSVLNLPADRPRPAVQTFQGAGYRFELPPELTRALVALSRQSGATLFMTLLSGWQLLLARFSGQDDILIGSPIAGRTRTEIEGLIGCFLNTLVLRTDLSGDPSFLDLLQRVRTTCLSAYDHQDVPFELVVEEVSTERDLSRHPIFQVMFVLQNAPLGTLDLPDLSMEMIEIEATTAKFDLLLSLAERGDHLSGLIQYNTDLFDHSTIARMVQQFQALLEQISQAPTRLIGEYSLLTAESARLLPDPRLELPEPTYPLITELFAAAVSAAPEHPALRQGKEQWSYAELAQRAETIARMLQAQGIQPGDVVAVHGPRSAKLIASMLAVLMSGGVLLTLDPRLPVQRRKTMLEEARARVMLVVSKQEWSDSASLGLMANGVVMLNPSTNQMLTPPSAAELPPLQPPALTPESPAYIFFTSGTTDVPKGILGCHKGLSHFLCWQRETFAIGPDDRAAQLTGLSFDVILREVFVPLISGAMLCLPPDVDDLSADQILPWMEREAISLLYTVPTLAQSWLDQAPPDVTLPGLRWIFFAGEPLAGTLVERCRAAFLGTGQIANLYGPTETTLAKCCYVVPTPVPTGVQPVGRPLPSAQALVLNRHRQLCSIGEPGEIVIRTPFRTLGYINASEEQQRRFVPSHFRDDPQDLLYYTGDLGRYRADGVLEILGRADDQVKIRGVRIELGEIETALNQHPAVQEATVLVQSVRADQKQLVAYLVPQRGVALNAPELSQYLRERLPSEMVPSAFVTLESFPLTPNGKLDRRALPTPGEEQRLAGATYTSPRDLVELKLVHIWEAVLNVRPIGVRDSFFDLGGHSLLALRLLSDIAREFGQRLLLPTLFQKQTIEQIAQLLRADVPVAAWSPLVPLQPHGTRPTLFMVHPAGGTVFCYMPLVRRLGPDQPLYAFQARGLEEGQTPSETIEQMAAEYLAALREVQPEGPYLLGGWSMGGLVAFEMAQQLQRQNQQVALLTVLDTHADPSQIRWTADSGLDELELQTLIDMVGPEHITLTQEQFQDLLREEQLRYALDVLKQVNAVPPETDLRQIHQFVRVFNTNGQAMLRYRAQPYPHPITLFQAEGSPSDPTDSSARERADVTLAWRGVAPDTLEVYSVPGTHDTMMTEPNIGVLAEHLKNCLERPAVMEED